MPKISLSADTSVEVLQSTIDVLRKQERKWRKSRSKRALYRYLGSIFRLYSIWKRTGVIWRAVDRIAKLTGTGDRHGRHPIRKLLDATSKADRRSKSRWTQALRYAWRERKKWPDLTTCFNANGGIAGCASRWTDQQSWNRTPPGFVRLGGDDRFPKVPFLVSVDMLDKYGNMKRD